MVKIRCMSLCGVSLGERQRPATENGKGEQVLHGHQATKWHGGLSKGMFRRGPLLY